MDGQVTTRVPSGAWYILALVPLCLGIALGVKSCVSIFGGVDEMPRFVVPGETDIKLDADDYIIFLERNSSVDGVLYPGVPASVSCAVNAVGDPQPLPLESPTMHSTYTINALHGESIFELSIPANGDFHFACRAEGAPGVLAVGTGMGGVIVTLVVSILGAVFLTIAVIMAVAVKRNRAKRRAWEESRRSLPV